MAHYLIVIAVASTPKAFERLEDLISGAVEKATLAGGIDGLTTEVFQGAAAEQTREVLRDAAAGRSRTKGSAS